MLFFFSSFLSLSLFTVVMVALISFEYI